MSNPFRDSSVWVRTLAFSAAILGISLGLCGLNLGAAFVFSPHTGAPSAPPNALSQSLSSVLQMTGLLEIVGMAIGAAGIVLSFLAIFIQFFWRLLTRKG